MVEVGCFASLADVVWLFPCNHVNLTRMPAERLSRPGRWPGRSTVLGRRGLVAASQPLAAQAGLDMLRKGGNAIDAAIATAATLCVVEPMSTGIGGDAFALYWSAKDGKLKGLNGSGRCPAKLKLDVFGNAGLSEIPLLGWYAVTVPGTVDAWWQLHQTDGRLAWKDLFEPAIHYARDGFPVSEVIAGSFADCRKIHQNEAAKSIYLQGGDDPGYGRPFEQRDLGASFEVIASGGSDAFYRGPVAEEMVRASDEGGGFLSRDDFEKHTSSWVEPVSTQFLGVDIHELPPNGQGIAALIALNILTALDAERMKADWGTLTHAVVEAVKLAYAERDAHIADPEAYDAPLRDLLSRTFATRAAMAIDPNRATARTSSLVGDPEGDTVYLCAADEQGNMVSLINSLYKAFGSGVVAGRTGIMLQNRGACFRLDPKHPNCLAPGKRPFHTIIPGFATRNGKPYMAFGVMGGPHQAQGHVQVLVNLLLHGMGLQESVSTPRFHFEQGNDLVVETDYPAELREALQQRGHQVAEGSPYLFGGGQAIRLLDEGVFEGASDPRKDGCAVGW